MVLMSASLPLNEKDDVRAETCSSLIRARELSISSVNPSEKYSCSLSPLIFTNGNTATEAVAGRRRWLERFQPQAPVPLQPQRHASTARFGLPRGNRVRRQPRRSSPGAPPSTARMQGRAFGSKVQQAREPRPTESLSAPVPAPLTADAVHARRRQRVWPRPAGASTAALGIGQGSRHLTVACRQSPRAVEMAVWVPSGASGQQRASIRGGNTPRHGRARSLR